MFQSLKNEKLCYREKELFESAWDCLIKQVVRSQEIERKFDGLQEKQTKLIDDVKTFGTNELLDKMIEETNSILSDIKKNMSKKTKMPESDSSTNHENLK